MLGERSSVLFCFEMQKLMAGAVMVSPYVPMLFMGEEWAETNPFLFFVSHSDPQLMEVVREGRKKEFEAFHLHGEAPDPFSKKTFQQSKLQWQLLNEEKHQLMFRFYQELIAIRKKHPSLNSHNRRNLNVECSREKNTLVLHRWHKEEYMVIMMNFSREVQFIFPPDYWEQWYKVFDSAHTQWLGKSKAPEKILSAELTPIEIAPNSFLLYSNQSK
jgi:maltooligosyltrehalose trehalohydrolase